MNVRHIEIRNEQESPYISFSRNEWKVFRENTPMTLDEQDLEKIKGIVDPISLLEIEEIYLPLTRLLNLQVANHKHTIHSSPFLRHLDRKAPYVIGVSGSVSVGKSTTSRALQALLSSWPAPRQVEIVNTDGFLYPNETLEKKNLMDKKGFPESYDVQKLLNFLLKLKAGSPNLKVPVYSHYSYDIMPNVFQTVSCPDIVILEGLNILQVNPAKNYDKQKISVSDFIDFSLFVHANTELIKSWYINRFMLFRDMARSDPLAYLFRFVGLSYEAAKDFATKIWININEANLHQNILPFKDRANLILVKGEDHFIEEILLKKI